MLGADAFPEARYRHEDAHIRWYFQDAQTRTATDYLHGPTADLITADEVKLTHAGDARVNSIAANRDATGVARPLAGGVEGEPGAVAGYGLAAPEANPRLLAGLDAFAAERGRVSAMDGDGRGKRRGPRRRLIHLRSPLPQHAPDGGQVRRPRRVRAP